MSTQRAYNWHRQFAAGVGQLTSVSGTAPKFVAATTQSTDKVNWAAQVFDAIGKTAKVADVVKQQSFAKAESFMKSHSLEEYRQAVNNNNIPFQDDPIAMARLKNLHGQISANMALQDFQQRVASNEFVGKTPEEVDAEFFKHMNKSFEELRDIFPYAGGGDSAYNTGFWENGNKSRKSIMDAQVIVQNDWNRKQSTMAETAKLNTVIARPNVTGEEIHQQFTNSYNFGAFNANPQESARVAESVMKNLANNPDGARLIDELKDKQIPGQKDGVTFGSIIGEDGLRSLRAKSLSVRDSADHRAYMEFSVGVNELVNQGDITGLMTAYEQEMEQTGGIASYRGELIRRGIETIRDKAYRQAEADEKALAKQQEENLKVINAYQMLERMVRGENVNPLDLEGTDKKAMDAAWVYAKSSMKPEDILKLATHPGANNPAREELNREVNTVLAAITSHMQLSKGDVLMSSEVPQPERLESLMSLYVTNPGDFMTATGGMRNDDANKLIGVYNALSSGTPYNEVVAGMAAFEATDRNERMKVDRILKDIVLQDSGAKSRGITGDYATTTVYVWAANGIKAGMTPNDAYEKAIERFNETHINVAGTAVPTGFFNSNNLNLPAEVAGDAIDVELKNILSTAGVPEEDVSVRYDVAREILLVQNNRTGTLAGVITQEALRPAYNKLVAEAEKAKMSAIEYAKSYNKSQTVDTRGGNTQYGWDFTPDQSTTTDDQNNN